MAPDMTTLGKVLVGIGIFIVGLGGLLWLGGRVPFLGRLPGDISFQRGGFSCYIPIVTSIVLSILLTILLNIIVRLLNR
jgi:hypothetical protein